MNKFKEFMIKHSKTKLPILILFLLILYITMDITLGRISEMETTLQDKTAQIDKLLDANNELATKLIEMEERERRVCNHIKDYILWINKTVPPLVANEIAKNIIIVSDKYDLPVTTILAVMERESHFNPHLISKAGARGLMQVMRIWVKEKELNIKNRFEFHDIEKGINAGTYVLNKYLKDNDNNMEKALLQYVNYDTQYVKDVYNSMGKFVVFKGINGNRKKEVILELDEEVVEEAIEQQKQEQPKTFTHTVIEGDTLSLIAMKYTGNIINWKKIQELNPNVIPERMQIGSTITLPIEMKDKT